MQDSVPGTHLWGTQPEMFGPRHEHRLAIILNEVDGLPPNARILDAAVGLGQLATRMRARSHRVFGLDYSFNAALYASRCGIPSVVGDMTKMPFGGGVFDGVTTGETLEHLDDDAAAARALVEERRLLRAPPPLRARGARRALRRLRHREGEVLGIPDRACLRHDLPAADEQATRAPRRRRRRRAAVGRARGARAMARQRRARGVLDRPAVRLDSVRAGAASGGEEAMRIAVADGAITADDLLDDWLAAPARATLTIDASLAGPLLWRLGASAYRRYLLGELDARAVADGAFEGGARSPLALHAAPLLPPPPR